MPGHWRQPQAAPSPSPFDQTWPLKTVHHDLDYLAHAHWRHSRASPAPFPYDHHGPLQSYGYSVAIVPLRVPLKVFLVLCRSSHSSYRPGLRRERADREFRRRGPDLLPACESGVDEDRARLPQTFGLDILGFDFVIKAIRVCLDRSTTFSAPGIGGEDMPC